MIAANTQVAQLDRSRLAKLKKLEKDLGKVVVAFEPQYRYADLSPDQIRRLQKAEQELGAILLAYDKA
jgi:hypothetical protein